jgi:hypothetical protein
LQMCRSQAVLLLNYPNIFVIIFRLGICQAHRSVRFCLVHRLHTSSHLWLVWVEKEKKLLKCQQHRSGQMTLTCFDLTKHATATWTPKTTANVLSLYGAGHTLHDTEQVVNISYWAKNPG